MPDFNLVCPVPLPLETVQMAHGGGGRVMRTLIETLLVPAFANPTLDARHDAALLDLDGVRLAFTTDTFVVTPRHFPGGDIGELAVYGTVNDLACGGARPRFLSCALILEEGLPLPELAALVASMQRAAARCGVEIVTGDTKVVDRGRGDGLYINTAGIGLVPQGRQVGPGQVRPGDAILVSGDLGRHGVAVLSVREGLAFEAPIKSDCAPIHLLAEALWAAGIQVHCLRDPTRGGLGAVLNEIALDSGLAIEVQERDIPVAEAVAAACELLGLDPLHVACEGRLVAFVPGPQAEAALAALRQQPDGQGAALIGRVLEPGPIPVTLRTRLGTDRILDLPTGEQLPRIC
jgi:hydrogenase expression/formation protein HypE